VCALGAWCCGDFENWKCSAPVPASTFRGPRARKGGTWLVWAAGCSRRIGASPWALELGTQNARLKSKVQRPKPKAQAQGPGPAAGPGHRPLSSEHRYL
jgi:hypothetical protein